MTGPELPNDTLVHAAVELGGQEPSITQRLLASAGVVYDPTIAPVAEIDPVTEEIGKLSRLLDGQDLFRGQYEITPVADVGYVIDLTETEVRPDKPWLLSDYDDFLIATTQAKTEHADAYAEHLEASRLRVNPELRQRALASANKFARWERDGQETYHIDANIVALGWTTEQLKASAGFRPAKVIDITEKKLERIGAGATVDLPPAKNDPFHFRNGELKVEDWRLRTMVPDRFLSVFKPIVRPSAYDDAFEAVGQVQGANLAIFTYGDPYWQAIKLVSTLTEQAKRGKSLDIAQIWLTKTSKGKFVEALAAQAGQPSEAIESGGLVLVDDDPRQLETFINADVPATLAAVRAAKDGTKTANVAWSPNGYNLATVFDTQEDSQALTEELTQMLGAVSLNQAA